MYVCFVPLNSDKQFGFEISVSNEILMNKNFLQVSQFYYLDT